MDDFYPVLWRTCRAIANKRRLRILWSLFDHGSQCSIKLSHNLEMSESQVSIHLKILAGHGLIQQYRRKMWVISIPEADQRVPAAEELMNALQTCHGNGTSIGIIFKQATAFTHSRRIEIIQALSMQGMSLEDLSQKAHIPESALNRHLNKLTARGFVKENSALYSKIVPNTAFSQALLRIITERLQP